jgi:hypothetical protein
MADRIRIIPHEAVPQCGSFEVRFPDGPAVYFYWDHIAGPPALTEKEISPSGGPV